MEYKFKVSYTDVSTKFVRPMVLTLWTLPNDRVEVSLYDSVPRKLFLKRCTVPEKLSLSAFAMNATVVVNARPYKVEGYGDAATERTLSSRGAALCLVLPEFYASAGRVLEHLEASGIALGRLRLVRLSEGDARDLLAAGEAGGAPRAPPGTAPALARDAVLAIECVGEDVTARLQEAVGPLDVATARGVSPRSLRALLGGAVVRVSSCPSAGVAEVAAIFEPSSSASSSRGGGGGGGGGGASTSSSSSSSSTSAAAAPSPHHPHHTAVFTHCSAVIVKPHAFAAGATGPVLHALLSAGLEVSALRSLALSRTDAGDFLEAYKGVAVEYERWVGELSSGVSVCMEVRGGGGVVERVRELCGPVDVAVARVLAPGSLRAQWGVDNVRNALQVTDVEVDGPLESKFLFAVVP